MINIETLDDVKILKELTKDNLDMMDLKAEILGLKEKIDLQGEIINKQNQVIEKLNSQKALTAQDVVDALLSHKEISLPKRVNIKPKIQQIKRDDDYFEIPQSLFNKGIVKDYNKILVKGNDLIHLTVKNQKMKIPVSTIQLLYMLEVQKSRGGKLLNEDVNHFCRVFNLTRQQISKVCYNLQERVFFEAINTIDNQIKQSSFQVIDDFIYIINKGKKFNTEISVDLFNTLIQIYVNSNKEFETIFKLSMEHKKINPIYLLTVLKRNTLVSEAILNKKVS